MYAYEDLGLGWLFYPFFCQRFAKRELDTLIMLDSSWDASARGFRDNFPARGGR
jgi:hypothetical protein